MTTFFSRGLFSLLFLARVPWRHHPFRHMMAAKPVPTLKDVSILKGVPLGRLLAQGPDLRNRRL